MCYHEHLIEPDSGTITYHLCKAIEYSVLQYGESMFTIFPGITSNAVDCIVLMRGGILFLTPAIIAKGTSIGDEYPSITLKWWCDRKGVLMVDIVGHHRDYKHKEDGILNVLIRSL